MKLRATVKNYMADGISETTVLEAKFVGNPDRSPFIEDSRFPDFLRRRTDAKIRGEFYRASQVLRDNDNPLTSFRVITNDPKAAPYFEKLMREYNIPGEVVVEPSNHD